MKVQVSKGGVIHLHEGSGVTLCGRECQGAKRMDHEDIKPSCQRCIKIEAKSVKVEPIKAEAAAQAEGAACGKAGKALVGNCSWSGEAAQLAFTHGWMTHHESCDCKISGGIGYTFDLATHAMIKNPPARQYTQAELDLAWRRLGGFERGNGKHKGSKARRVRSHA